MGDDWVEDAEVERGQRLLGRGDWNGRHWIGGSWGGHEVEATGMETLGCAQ